MQVGRVGTPRWWRSGRRPVAGPDRVAGGAGAGSGGVGADHGLGPVPGCAKADLSRNVRNTPFPDRHDDGLRTSTIPALGQLPIPPRRYRYERAQNHEVIDWLFGDGQMALRQAMTAIASGRRRHPGGQPGPGRAGGHAAKAVTLDVSAGDFVAAAGRVADAAVRAWLPGWSAAQPGPVAAGTGRLSALMRSS